MLGLGLVTLYATQEKLTLKQIITVILTAIFGVGCASLRTNAVIPVDFSSQPPRAAIRAVCNGEAFTTQGTIVCEQKAPSQAQISVKVPPLEGRVVYSNGSLKGTDDFNWYPKEGFWLWKKKPIKDTWLDLDLGQIAGTFGEWPVALDVVALHKDVGVIDTRGVIYHRVCDDKAVPCSRLEVEYTCAGFYKSTGPNRIGKCDRLAGSPQGFDVKVKQAKSGAVLYVVAHRLGVKWALDVSGSEIGSGFKKVELPAIPNGPTLVDLELAWWEGSEIKSERTSVLMVGFDPAWTGLDRPHYMQMQKGINWVKPVLSDMMEVNLYRNGTLVSKQFGTDRVLSGPRPRAPGEVSCAMAWQRSSSDLAIQCLDHNDQEVSLP